MTKAKENTAVAKVQLSEAEMELLNSQSSKGLNDLMNLFEHFEQKDSSELKNLTSEYLELKENTIYNMAFVGMTTFSVASKQEGGEPETRDAAILVDKNMKQYINGGAVLVSACKKIEKIPSFIRIHVKGKKASGSGEGKYLEMDVHTI